MNEPSLADKTFHIIMRRMVETGQAPHFTEIAAKTKLYQIERPAQNAYG